MKTLKKRLFTLLISSSLIAAMIPSVSSARERGGDHDRGDHDRGRFERHDSHFGFWFGPSPYWHPYYAPRYYYPPRTVIVVPAPEQPPVAVIQPQAPVAPPTAYYCKATGTYYPDTMTCPGGWTPVVPGGAPS